MKYRPLIRETLGRVIGTKGRLRAVRAVVRIAVQEACAAASPASKLQSFERQRDLVEL